MAADSAASKMALVVAGVAADLEARGFKKRRHTFNRVVEPGLVHVVGFQVERVPFGAPSSLRRGFAVNLGVFVQEVYEVTERRPAPVFAREYECEFRVRLGELLAPPMDGWWSFEDEAPFVATEIPGLLSAQGAAWFDSYATRDHLVRAHDGPGGSARTGLVLAILLAHRGERDGARSSLREYLAAARRAHRSPKHLDWVLDVAARLGFDRADLA